MSGASARPAGNRRRCPTGKLKYFNEAWAQIAADRQSDNFGSSLQPYRCRCGWWHTFNRTKKRIKNEPRNARRRRVKRGEPPPSVVKRRQQKSLKRRRSKVREEQPIRVWEDDGGACVWPSKCPDTT